MGFNVSHILEYVYRIWAEVVKESTGEENVVPNPNFYENQKYVFIKNSHAVFVLIGEAMLESRDDPDYEWSDRIKEVSLEVLEKHRSNMQDKLGYIEGLLSASDHL